MNTCNRNLHIIGVAVWPDSQLWHVASSYNGCPYYLYISLLLYTIIKFVDEWCQTPEAVDVLNYLNLTAASLGNHEPLGVSTTEGRCPLGWSKWMGVSWGIGVFFGLFQWANPWQIHGKSCSLSTASAYFWCTYPLVNCKRWHNYWVWKITILSGENSLFLWPLSCGDPTGFFAALIPRAFHLWTQNCG